MSYRCFEKHPYPAEVGLALTEADVKSFYKQWKIDVPVESLHASHAAKLEVFHSDTAGPVMLLRLERSREKFLKNKTDHAEIVGNIVHEAAHAAQYLEKACYGNNTEGETDRGTFKFDIETQAYLIQNIVEWAYGLLTQKPKKKTNGKRS